MAKSFAVSRSSVKSQKEILVARQCRPESVDPAVEPCSLSTLQHPISRWWFVETYLESHTVLHMLARATLQHLAFFLFQKGKPCYDWLLLGSYVWVLSVFIYFIIIIVINIIIIMFKCCFDLLLFILNVSLFFVFSRLVPCLLAPVFPLGDPSAPAVRLGMPGGRCFGGCPDWVGEAQDPVDSAVAGEIFWCWWLPI